MGIDLVSGFQVAKNREKRSKISRKNGKMEKNRGVGYEKSMFPHDKKGTTIEYQLLMHR